MSLNLKLPRIFELLKITSKLVDLMDSRIYIVVLAFIFDLYKSENSN